MYFLVTITFMSLLVGWVTAIGAATGGKGDKRKIGDIKRYSTIALAASFISVTLMFFLYPIGSYSGVVLLYGLGVAPAIIIPVDKFISALWLAGLLLVFELITETPEPPLTVVLCFVAIICLVLSLAAANSDDRYYK